ncbi:MAG: RsmE family RNA methyltransferase, partial [Proteobacteria bacterium]|nr:RsmE family RNA methyltransferase [Pseudomonadota bacterium]
MRRFQSGAIPESGDVRLDEAMSHHLLRVTRIRVGEQVELFDGRGKVARATLLSDDQGVAVLSIDEPPRLAAPAHAAHLLIGIPKGPAMDLAIRMATEAGATHIHPVLLQRSVAKGDRYDRWTRIARSSAQQCGRGDIPELLPLAKLEEAAARLPEDVGRYVAHPGGEAASSATGAFA